MHNKAVTYENLKEYQKAIDCYDQLLHINPEDTKALKNKAVAYENL